MQTSTERSRARRYRLKQAEIPYENKKSKHERNKQWKRQHPQKRTGINVSGQFIGCDGEGGGLDSEGRQLFKLFRIGDRELYRGGQPLPTLELLSFICDSPRDAILVGFSFGYDVTMILRDLPSERRARLLSPKERGAGKSPYTYFGNFGIDYLQKNYFRVCRIKRVFNEGKEIIKIIPGSSRTIYETFGFFQWSFLKSLHYFNIGQEHWEMLEANKTSRGEFGEMTDDIRYYNKIECELLAQLMEKLRENCAKAGIVPRTWNGAGKLAEALHISHGTIRRKEVENVIPRNVLDMAGEAYYGGRFEVSRIGKIPGPIYENDLNSAYPAAMLALPCLQHGTWKPVSRSQLKRLDEGLDNESLYLASVTFEDKEKTVDTFGRMGGLPIRNKNGGIYWPQNGAGVYWACELRSAAALGYRLRHKKAFKYSAECECKPFNWISELYEIRKSLGKSTEGYPIKLGLNSLYGKLAQRIGAARYHNIIWAGLITAQTRAKLNEAIALNPRGICMIATDGIYSTQPLDLPIGEGLGQWECSILQDGLFIVQPGLYWGAKKPKTRGLPLTYFEKEGRVELFHQAWERFREQDTAAGKTLKQIFCKKAPSVTVNITNFIGMKLAQSRGKPETAGKWVSADRELSFDWSTKRGNFVWRGEHVITCPIRGNIKTVSYAHREMQITGRSLELDALRAELDDQPDYFDISPPFKD